MNTRTKLIGTIAIGAALFAPVAQAERPDDRPGLRGPGGIAAVQDAVSTHPDNRAEARGPGAFTPHSSATSHPDNRAGARGPGAVAPTVVVGSSSSGFDWGDALIGGVGGMGAALLLTGGLFLLLSQRNRAHIA